MMRETIQAKAHRLLLAGRLTVVHVAGETIDARIQGDSGMHRLGYQRGRGWWCSCPHRTLGGRGRACSHLAALQLVAGKTARQTRTITRPSRSEGAPHARTAEATV